MENLCTSKGHCQKSEKVMHGMRENICKPFIWKGIDNQNIQKTKQKNTSPQQKTNLI